MILLPEPGSVSHTARCLSSEHAVIVKEQTAQAIANTARAYEKKGVEAALSEVQLPLFSPLPEIPPSAAFNQCLPLLSFFCLSLSSTLSPLHSAATA